MSARVLAAAPFPAEHPEAALRRTRIYRLGFGMALSSGIAFGIAWPLSFITPLLAAKLLTRPAVLPLKGGVIFIVLLSVILGLSSRILIPTLQYPAVHLLLTGLLLFLLFYAKAGGTKPLLIVLLAAGVAAVPLIATISVSLALAAVDGIVFAAIIALLTMYVAAAFFPDPVSGPAKAREAGEPEGGQEETLSRSVRAGLALRSVIVLYPLVVVLQFYSLASATVVLMQAILMSLEPTFGKQLGVGGKLVLVNLVGGLLAVVIYNLLVFVPAFPFFVLLMLLTGLWMGTWVFSDHPLGKLLGGGVAAFFVILGPTLTGDAQAGSDLYIRLVLILGAVAYVVLMFGLLERLRLGRRLAS